MKEVLIRPLLAMHDRPNIAPGANYSRKQRENERTRVSLTVLVL